MQKEFDFMFLAEGELPFLLGSLKNMIDEKGFKTEKGDIKLKELTRLDALPFAFILDAEVLNRNKDSKTFLVDLCIEQAAKLILIGDPVEIDKASAQTISSVILATFPRPINNTEVVAKLESFMDAIRSKNKQKRILVIDDSPSFLRLISSWLEENYTVSICPSASAAFHMIESNKPDLILLDYEMPVCNGAQFLGMLHSEPVFAKIPVMFLTSKDDMETVSQVLALKPQGYLLKTQSKEAIVNKINDFFVGEMLK